MAATRTADWKNMLSDVVRTCGVGLHKLYMRCMRFRLEAHIMSCETNLRQLFLQF